jgi:hypothetical protein
MVMGLPVDIEPHEALLQCVRIAAGEVAYCNSRIGALSHEEAVGHPIKTAERIGEGLSESYVEIMEETPELNIWIRARHNATERLAKFSRMALDAGVNERRVRIAEGMAQLLAPVLKSIFDQLE